MRRSGRRQMISSSAGARSARLYLFGGVAPGVHPARNTAEQIRESSEKAEKTDFRFEVSTCTGAARRVHEVRNPQLMFAPTAVKQLDVRARPSGR